MIIEELTVQSFKGFQKFTLPCSELTVLVGENNSGKTSILQALQVISSILRFAFGDGESPNFEPVRWQSNPESQFRKLGYPPHLSDEIWHNRITSQPCNVSVKLSEEIEVNLDLPGPQSYRLDILEKGTSIKTNVLEENNQELVTKLYRWFRTEFVPPVGTITPVEKNLSYPELENMLRDGKSSEVWRVNLYWIYNDKKEAFGEYVAAIRKYLPEIELLAPRLAHNNPSTVEIRFKDKGTNLDILSGGGGLRTIMSLLARIVFTDARVLLFDEPDAHLHGTLQREIARMLSDYVSENEVQIFVSTHAPDFIAEVPLESLVWIDRGSTRGLACEGIGKILAELGSMSHIDAIRAVGADKVLFVEGNMDKGILGNLMSKTGFQNPFEDNEVLTAELPGGKGDKRHVTAFARFQREVFKCELKMGCITDNDYEMMPNDTTSDAGTNDQVIFTQLGVKEVENYLIGAEVIYAAANCAATRRNEHSANECKVPRLEEIRNKLEEVLEIGEIQDAVKWHFVAQYAQRQSASLSDPTILREGKETFDEKWADFEWKIRNCPGKKVLKRVREWIQREFKLTITNKVLVEAMDECPKDVVKIAKDISGHFWGERGDFSQ